jgi:NAD(P)-dependent dehydrogenase (short-subunit alcohol dehydrogenase family)
MVTGGNRGIGLAIARGLARAGANVAIWGRDRTRNDEAVAELRAMGADVAAFDCDVADEEQVVEQTKATVAHFGRIDSCFANAGFGRVKPFLEMTAADWNSVIQVNLTGAFFTFREAARHMVERGGGGKLIGTASVGSIHGMPRQEHYSASKAGLCALVRGLAVELARHDIQANAILPGWIETEMTAGAKKWKALDEAIIHRTPAKRWGRPDDFEGVAVYLASAASRFHTGDVLRVDGGYAVF